MRGYSSKNQLHALCSLCFPLLSQFTTVYHSIEGMMYDEKLTNFEFKTTTKTVPLKTSFVHNGSDIARLILLVIYIVWILAYLYSE
eukprot:1145291-Pelagomonas_calceolata.AAC.1